MANPVTHLEKTIAGEVQPVTHLEKVIAEYGGGDVYEQLEAGTNILIEETSDGKAKISASGEVSSEDTVARAEIAEMKDGTTIDSFGDVETALATKADTSSTYTKTEVDTALSAKANSADVYSKSDIDTAMSAKADKSTTYTKTEVDTALGNKVDKVSGKGLSTNDYTTAEKTKLGALAEIKSIGTGLSLDSSTGELTATGGGSGGTTDYRDLSNKPQINSVTLSGNKSLSDLGITYESKTAASGGTALSLVTTGEKYTWNSKQSALTTEQLAAVNSGITSADVAQITTNKNNISTLQTSLAVGSSDNAKVLTAIYEGGEGSYAWVTPSGGGGTSDYTDLTNKPQINGITLNGNKSLANLGIAAAEDIPTLVSGLNTTGTVKNGSSVTSATGYTPSPIISGIPYYKDTTYESKSAASGGTAVSLCTTGEKYIWNNKQSALTTAQLSAVNSGIDSTKVAQIVTNEANILWSKTSLQYSVTAADTYEYTGLSIACPANTLMEIWVIDDNSNSRITAIAVTDSNTSIDAVGTVIGENAEPLTMDAGAQWAREVHCVTPRLYGSVHTYYVWVKRGSTGANNVTLLTRKIVTQ